MPILHAERSPDPIQPSRVQNQTRELEICALYSGGETMQAIANRYRSSYTGRSLTRERVRQILKRNGLGGDGQYGRIDPLKVLAAVRDCDTLPAIAKMVGSNVTAVTRVLHALAPTAVDEMMAYRHEGVRARLVARLQSLAASLGRTPTAVDVGGNSQFALCFGSFTKAQAAAGLKHRKGTPHMTPAQRAEIALRYEPPPPGNRGGNARALAQEYGVDPCYISDIAKSFRRKVAA